MKLGEKIYQLRRRMGLSQEELAERVGVTRQAVSKWEQGTSVPELETLVALAKTFDVSADYLLSDDVVEPETQKQNERAKEDWLDRLPGFVGKLFRRYGWVAGAYTAIMGVVFFALGAISQYSTRRLFDGFLESATGMNGMMGGFPVDGFGMIDMYNQQVDSMVSNFAKSNPVNAVSTVIMVLGAVMAIGGTVLAVLLKKRNHCDT